MSKQKKELTLTIPTPCGEDFNNMVPVKGGKFCGACEKTIVDFRKMDDRQILRFYEKNEGKICGVFSPHQLNRAIPFPTERTTSRNWKAIAALASGLLFTGSLMGQSTNSTQPVSVVQTVVNGDIIEDEKNNSTSPTKHLKGFIKNSMDNEPLIGATILIKGMKTSAISDFDGFFEVVIPANLATVEVSISYTGYEPQTLLFNQQNPIPNQNITIKMQETISTFKEPMIMGIIIAETGEKGVCQPDIDAKITEDIPEITPDFHLKPEKTPSVTVYPNPFSTQLNVDFEYPINGDYLFHIYDMNGSLIYAKTYNLLKGHQTVALDMVHQNLVDGNYILQISDRQDRILTSKKVASF